MEDETVEEYKKLIIDMVNSLTDEKFLRQIYTILIQYKRRAGM
jgi:hypothetical protein